VYNIKVDLIFENWFDDFYFRRVTANKL